MSGSVIGGFIVPGKPHILLAPEKKSFEAILLCYKSLVKKPQFCAVFSLEYA